MVEPFSDFRQILEDGYYPKMTTTMAERNIPPRQNNMYWYNLKRTEEEMVLNITDLERWRDRIIDAIDRGFAFDVCISHTHTHTHAPFNRSLKYRKQ